MTTSTKEKTLCKISGLCRGILIVLIVLMLAIPMGCTEKAKSPESSKKAETVEDTKAEDTLFTDTKNEMLKIAGTITGKENYFKVDSYPDEYKNMEPAYVALIKDDARENVLSAVKYANEAFGFDESLYTGMMETTAEMGEQSAENDNYKITWTHSADDGLEVTYSIK